MEKQQCKVESMGINPSFWKGKRVLLTGHSGFKGSWLCLWLHRMGAKVSGLSLNDPVSIPNMFSALNIYDLVNDNRGDVSDYETCFEIVKNTQPEIVIHMAAQSLVRLSYSYPLKTYNINVLGTANVLEAIRECESVKSIVIITTDKCYENVEKEYAYVETDSLGGYDPYSSSKACAEHVASAYYRSFFKNKGIGLATARAGNVIGGGDWSADRLIPDMVKSWSKNEKLFIRYPLATRPWQNVLEPLYGYISLAEHLWKTPVEFSSGWNFGPNQNSVKTVQETVDLAANVWGDSVDWMTSSVKHLHEANHLQLNSSKAHSLLGWQPKLDFDEAVNKTINWYKTYYTNNQEMMEYTLNQIAEYESRNINV
jgi:CDP-glucose 4,6-dehydratase